ncbi:RNA-binding protein 25-like [Ixodes scapularis]|uniref:RNA-binding protein 25-like n=1 Tax=Ixodes scapularis TaxID=6945 RepID=UPI001AD6ABF8|nr:RNA-binding protein 25-like [Ixodes scapularis]
MAIRCARRTAEEEQEILRRLSNARSLTAFLEHYDDRVADCEFYSGESLRIRRENFAREKFLDIQDYLEEKDEMDSLKARLEESTQTMTLESKQEQSQVVKVTTSPGLEDKQPGKLLRDVGSTFNTDGTTSSGSQDCHSQRELPFESEPPKVALAEVGTAALNPIAPSVVSRTPASSSSGCLAKSPAGSLPAKKPRTALLTPRPIEPATALARVAPLQKNCPADPRLRSKPVAVQELGLQPVPPPPPQLPRPQSLHRNQARVVPRSNAQVDFQDVCQHKEDMQRLLNAVQAEISSDGSSDSEEEHTAGSHLVTVAKCKSPRESNLCTEQESQERDNKRRMYVKSLIPSNKKELMAYQVDPKLVSKRMIRNHILPWVRKKCKEYKGALIPSLEDLLTEKLGCGTSTQELLQVAMPVFGKDTEVFVLRLWRLLIYKTESTVYRQTALRSSDAV